MRLDRTKNKLKDLNDILFVQLEKLSDDDLTEAALKQEIDKANAISQLANSVISIGKLQLQAVSFVNKKGLDDAIKARQELPAMFPDFAVLPSDTQASTLGGNNGH